VDIEDEDEYLEEETEGIDPGSAAARYYPDRVRLPTSPPTINFPLKSSSPPLISLAQTSEVLSSIPDTSPAARYFPNRVQDTPQQQSPNYLHKTAGFSTPNRRKQITVHTPSPVQHQPPVRFRTPTSNAPVVQPRTPSSIRRRLPLNSPCNSPRVGSSMPASTNQQTYNSPTRTMLNSQRLGSPTQQRFISPNQQRIRSTTPQRFNSPNQQRFTSPNHQRFTSPNQQQFTSPNQQRFSTPNQQRFTSPNQQILTSPNQQRIRSNTPQRFSSPNQQRNRSTAPIRFNSPNQSRISSPSISRISGNISNARLSPQNPSIVRRQIVPSGSPSHTLPGYSGGLTVRNRPAPQQPFQQSRQQSRNNNPNHSRQLFNRNNYTDDMHDDDIVEVEENDHAWAHQGQSNQASVQQDDIVVLDENCEDYVIPGETEDQYYDDIADQHHQPVDTYNQNTYNALPHQDAEEIIIL